MFVPVTRATTDKIHFQVLSFVEEKKGWEGGMSVHVYVTNLLEPCIPRERERKKDTHTHTQGRVPVNVLRIRGPKSVENIGG